MNSKKTLLTMFLVIMSFLSIETSLFAYKPARASARQKACFSNQRVLSGAIEMYNMDHTDYLPTSLPGGDFEELQNILIKEKYIKSFIEGPEDGCSYGLIVKDPKNFDFDVFCKKHGTIETTDIDKPIIPTYNSRDEKPFSEEYTRKKAAKNREKAIHAIMYQLLNSPLFYVFFIIFIIFISNTGKKKQKS